MPTKARHLIDRLADRSLLERAADEAIASVKDKTVWYVRAFVRKREEYLDEIQNMIVLGIYPPKTYKTVPLQSAHKLRDITPMIFYPWSILFHAVKIVLAPIVDRLLIYDSSAGRRNKGQVFAAQRIRMFIRRYPEYTHIVVADMRKYYQSLPHTVIVEALTHVVDDALFLQLIEHTMLDYQCDIEPLLRVQWEKKQRYCHWADHTAFRHFEDRGVTIGNPISQDIGNLCYARLDRLLKETLRVKCYHRHCDDVVFLARSQQDGERLLHILDTEAGKIGLCLKASSFVAPLQDDEREVKGRKIDFVGYQFWRSNQRMRKHIKQNFARKLKGVKSKRRRREIVSAYWGIAKWGKCMNLFRTILRENGIMSFADVGIKTEIVKQGVDGKRMFDVPSRKVGELAREGREIIIHDFEPDITIHEKGGKCSILFRYADGKEEDFLKFISSSALIADKLKRARQLEAGGTAVFPQPTKVFEVRLSKGQYTYDIE